MKILACFLLYFITTLKIIKCQFNFDIMQMLNEAETYQSTNKSANQTAPEESLKVRILSLGTCQGKKDLIRVKKLFYPKIFTVPGEIELNGTVVISNKLPNDWDVAVDVQLGHHLGYTSLPCNNKCNVKKICSTGKLMEKCEKLLPKTNYTGIFDKKLCSCDVDKGTYNVSNMKVPLKISAKGMDLIKRFLNTNEIKFDMIFKSSITEQRFACLRGAFRLVTPSNKQEEQTKEAKPKKLNFN